MSNIPETRSTAEAERANQVAKQFLDFLRERNWEAMQTIMSEHIIWNLPGRSQISGRAEGVAAVIARAQKIVSYGLSFRLEHMLFGQDGVAIALNNTARRGDLVLDEHLATVMTLQDGKITAINTYLSDIDMANAFFV